ncbi:hypothetical protein V8E55_007017 [Tylopilus felleus]
MQANTLGILYILAARLHTGMTGAPNIRDLLTLLAVAVPLLAEAAGNVALAIQPLFDLLTRYAPTPSHLTTIHPVFLIMCVSTRHFAAALPVLAHPISTMDISISDLTIVYTALKRWLEAQEFFEICACSPGSAAAAIQMEALRKFIIVQLIHEGETTPPPKYIHPGTPYSAFVNAYPDRRRELREIVDGELVFTTVRIHMRVPQALERALSDIANAVGIESVDEVRALIVDMVRQHACVLEALFTWLQVASSEISAQLSEDGTVSFFVPRVAFEKADVNRVLAQAQEQPAQLVTARSKEYLIKVRCT